MAFVEISDNQLQDVGQFKDQTDQTNQKQFVEISDDQMMDTPKPVGLVEHIGSKLLGGYGGTIGSALQAGARAGEALYPKVPVPVDMPENLKAAINKYDLPTAEESGPYKLGSAIRKKSGSLLRTNPELEDSFLASDVPQAIGSTLGFATTGVLGGGTGGVALTGALANRQEAYEKAQAAGATPTATKAAETVGGIVGLTEAVPVEMMFGRLNKLTGGKLRDRLVKAGISGASEFLQEFGQSVAGNTAAKALYDSNQPIFDNSFREGAAGGMSGLLVDFVGQALGIRMHHKTAANQKVTEADFAPTTGPAATQPGSAYSDAEVEAQYEAARRRIKPTVPAIDATQFYPTGYGLQEKPFQILEQPTPTPLVSPPILTGPETRATGPATSILPTELPPHSEPALPARQAPPPRLYSPVRELLQQRFTDRTIAEHTAVEATKEYGRSFYVWGTKKGYELRLTPQVLGPHEVQYVGKTDRPSNAQASSENEQTEAERLRLQVITSEGLTQEQVDNAQAEQWRRELAERRARDAQTIRSNQGQVDVRREAGEESQAERGQDLYQPRRQQASPEQPSQEVARQIGEQNEGQIERQRQEQEGGQRQAITSAKAIEGQEGLQVAPTQAQTQVSSELEQTTQMLQALPENQAGFRTRLSAGVLMSKLRKQFPTMQLEVSKQPDNMWRIQPRVEAPKAVTVKAPAKRTQRLGQKRDVADQILEEEGLSELDFDEDLTDVEEGTAGEESGYKGLTVKKLYSFDPIEALRQGHSLLWRSKMQEVFEKRLPKYTTAEELRASIPMYLYSTDLLQGVKQLNEAFDKLPGGGALTRLGNTYRKNLSIPSWAALVKEKFGAWYKQSSQIAAKWEEPLYESLSTLDGWHRLAHAEYQKLNKMAWDIEGRKLKAVPSHQLVFSKDAQGRKQVALNPQYLKELEAFMRTKGFSEDAIQTFVATRKGMDQDFANHYNALAKNPQVDQTVLEQLEQNIGFVPNYLPHNFYGNHFIEGRDANGELRARLPIQIGALGKMLGATTKVGRLIKALESVPEYQGLRWDRTLKSSDEQSRYYINTPVSTEVIGRVLDEAAKSLETQDQARPELADAAKAIREALPSEVLEILRTRGFSNYAKRSGILGYEKSDLLRVLADYKVGMYGSLRKMETAREYARHMLESKPEKLEWDMLQRYFEDQMAPRGRIDSLVATARDIMYMRYMSGRVKPAIVNLSNQIVTGIPLLGLHAGPASVVLHTKALAQTTAQFALESKQKLKRIGLFGHPISEKNIIPTEMIGLIKKAQVDGTVQPQMVREMLRDLKTGYRAVPKTLNKMVATSRDLLTLPMETTEWYSRVATFKASADAMSEGKISNPKTLAEYGLQRGEKVPLSDPRVYDFARTITLQSHGEYGMHNRPPIVRSGTVGKLASAAYTFRFFNQNLMELWTHMLKQGPRGYAAFTASIAGQVITGGLLKGIPFAGTMMLMYGALTGDDPEEKLRSILPGSENTKDALLYGGLAYGIPTPFGNIPKVAVGSSVEFDLPESVQELLKYAVSGQDPIIRDDPTTEAVGVVGGTVRDMIGAFNAWASGNKERALEYISPLIILRDILAANRLATEGTYSLTGRPIVQPGEAWPQTITPEEARMRVLGFQPLSIEKGYRLRTSIERAGMFRKGAQNKLASRFANAFNEGNSQEMVNVLDEILAWNIRWGASEHPEYMINPKSAIETRLKPTHGDSRLRGRALELRRAYGF